MKWTSKKKNRAFEALFTYGGHHRRWLWRGGLASIGVVFFRLLMPWPLRGVIDIVFGHGSKKGAMLVAYLPQWGDMVLMLAAAYFLLALGLGVSEMIQRVNLKRFAALTAHEMRAAAVEGAGLMPLHKRTATGDIVARIIGDSARIKAGLSGIMVHGLKNGLLFLAACAVITWVSWGFGLIFFVSGLIAIYIGLRTATPVAGTASKLRRKEGAYATALQEGLEGGLMDLKMDDINWSNARKSVTITRMIARSSVLIHLVLGGSVSIALVVGARGVEAGTIAPGDLFIFIAYALTLHRRMVQVGRQIARSGKVLACADRIEVYARYARTGAAEAARAEEGPPAPVPLVSGIRLERARLDTGPGREGKPRLRRTDLFLEPGSRVAVTGSVGAGKTSLLNILAGVEAPDKGRIFWDDEKMLRREGGLSSRVAYLPQAPVFPPAKVWKHLGLSGPEALSPEDEETLRRIGAWKLIQSFRKGLDQKVGSSSLSRNEARLLRLGGILISDRSSVWVLDSPLTGLAGKKAAQCLEEIFSRAGGRLLVVALSDQSRAGRFERLLYLRKGRIQFDGRPGDFAEWKAGRESEKESGKKEAPAEGGKDEGKNSEE